MFHNDDFNLIPSDDEDFRSKDEDFSEFSTDQFLNFDDTETKNKSTKDDNKRPREETSNDVNLKNNPAKKLKTDSDSDEEREEVPKNIRVDEYSKKNKSMQSYFFTHHGQKIGHLPVISHSISTNSTKEKKFSKPFFFGYFADNNNLFHSVSNELSVALGVITGKFYRLIYGKSHPRYYFGKSDSGLSYRLSEQVSPRNKKHHLTLGLMLLPLISYIVGDYDHDESNVFIAHPLNRNKQKANIIIKIDPGCGFSNIQENASAITQHIQFLLKPEYNPFKERSEEDQLKNYDSSESNESSDSESSEDEENQWNRLLIPVPEFFKIIFKYPLYSDSYNYMSFEKVFMDDTARKTELFIGLYLFLRHPIERYLAIIDKVLDTVSGFEKISLKKRGDFTSLADYKQKLKNTFDTRYTAFKNIAENLPDYQSFVANKEYLSSEVYQAYVCESEQEQVNQSTFKLS